MMDIDQVLKSLGMGRYQVIGCILFGLIIMYSNVSPVTYVFTASDLKYRCEIPECDAPNSKERTYQPEWLQFTMPYRNDTKQPRKCQRYAALSGPLVNGTRCSSSGFNNDAIEWCRDSWVFEDFENTIGTEFGLMCEDNKWKLSMVGTVNNFGQFIGIPMSGIIADRYGRKFTMVFCAVTSAALCIVQSFSTSYLMFLILELLSSTVSSGIYSITFILAMELFLPHQRVLYYSILECFLPVGSILVAYVASFVKDWRLLLQIVNIPGLLFLSYFWLTEESMKWLESQGKHDKVINTLKKIAAVNKKPFPNLHLNTQTQSMECLEKNDANFSGILKDIIRSSTIFWRMIRCSYVWIAVTLVYYGLTVSSTDIAGDKYLNFSLVLFIEIPACLLNWLIMEGMSRKKALCCMFVLSGITCVMYNLMSGELFLIKLLLFLVSKLAISIAFCIIYMLTAEIFPTRMRATMMSMCSMLGRIGSMLAPQATLLTEYFGVFATMLVFGLTAFAAAGITMTLPESKNIKLPDTINEAEKIGTNVKPQNIDINSP
ncbi:solute carrier family 22 member 21-like [Melanaphis sacchari]|uniref:Solute carrier family 22 member 21 n=1 Tax=Melanaphis sacchari TaxID=742174 RepID=A0A2H8TNU8_9HEMI|nr:solute carrier family 22 member 21-like [Melanaphis sacchari]XP_025207597.1 solute carrier family 22 member 21-like [Melanaphis sacchari]